MRLWDFRLSCDHQVLIFAATFEEAQDIAYDAAAGHHARVEGHAEIPLHQRGVLVWYPGPIHPHAINPRRA